jgi:trans-aconitate 2-methyltransferase
MPSWEAQLYLRFADERTQPARDLTYRIVVPNARRIVDLGCGPGNSTAVLRARWPEAQVVGLDSSQAMIDAARAEYPTGEWLLGDVATWRAAEPFDVVFANAVLHWVPDHAALFPRLLAQVAAGGALAVQMPVHHDSLLRRLIERVADDATWRSRMGAALTAMIRERPPFYYDLLQPHAARVELWATAYYHQLDGPAAIVDWVRGTGLRPFLDALDGDDERARFEQLLLGEVAAAYQRHPDGRVLFPFRRLFVIAYR